MACFGQVASMSYIMAYSGQLLEMLKVKTLRDMEILKKEEIQCNKILDLEKENF